MNPTSASFIQSSVTDHPCLLHTFTPGYTLNGCLNSPLTDNQPPGSVAPGDMPSAYGQQAINIPMAPTPTLPQLLNQQAQQELAAAQRAKLNPADNQAPGSTAPGQQSAAAMAAQMPRAAQPNVMPGVGFNPQAAQGMFPLVQGGQPMFMNLTQGGQPMFATLPAPNYSEYFARIQAAQMGAYGQPSQGASQLPQPSTMPTVAAAGRGKPAAPGAAMQPQVASVPAPLPPRPPSLPNLPETARATAQALEDERAAARKAAADAVARSFPSITRPQTREDQEVLPLPRLQALVKETCGPAVELTPDSESALKALAEDFVCGAVEFAVDMAKKKKARKLDPADLALYFMRTW